jgi:hypothetical protein
MSKLIAVLAAGTLAIAGAAIHAADEPVQSGTVSGAQEPGGTNDPGSAEKQHQHAPDGVKAAGGAGTSPGRENDPCSAEGGAQAAGGDVKCKPEQSAGQAGRASDPASAEKNR